MQVLLVADTTVHRLEDQDEDSDFEIWSEETIEEILSGLAAAGHDPVHVSSPAEIISSIKKVGIENSVVLSIWSGRDNRNRRSFAPAICEMLELSYVGPDPYAALVTADKKLSKVLCDQYCVITPNDIVIRRNTDLSLLSRLRLPVVVKPLFEGGSIGINQSSLVRSIEDARKKAEWSLQTFKQPAIVEEFVRGREVNFCLMRSDSDILVRCVDICVGQDDFFDDHLYGHDIKRNKLYKRSRVFEDITDEIDLDLIDRLKCLFEGLGKVDFMRIDGKLDPSGAFSCIELSCDPDIGTKSSFYGAYRSICGGFPAFLDQLISSRKS